MNSHVDAFELAAAGLLHDVGKVLQPAGLPLFPDAGRLEPMICPVYHGHYSHKHVLFTAQVLDSVTSNFGGLDRNYIERIAIHHHKPSAGRLDEHWLTKADWLASGHDRESTAEEEERTGLAPIVAKWGVTKKLVPISVYQELLTLEGLKKGRCESPDPPPIEPVPGEDLEKTLPELGSVVRDMVELQLLTGARPGELCSLRPIDVDRSGEVWEYRPTSHKLEHHGKDRVVCFGEKAKAILIKYLEGRSAEAYCFSPAEAEQQRLAKRHAARKTPLSCGNRPGSKRADTPKRRPKDCYTVDSYRRAIVRACKRAGVPAWAPNRLRHTRATELRKLFGIEAVRTVLGHSRLNTSEIYAERDLAEVRRIMRQVG